VVFQPISKVGISHVCIKLLVVVLSMFVLEVKIPNKTSESL